MLKKYVCRRLWIKPLENIFTLVSYRDTKSYDLAIIEINERISRIKDESTRLEEAIKKIKSFGQDYNCMTEAQQYELGSYVNLMNSSTQLLVNPIMGLQPKYTEEDLEKYSSERNVRILCGSKPLIFYGEPSLQHQHGREGLETAVEIVQRK